MTGIVAPAHRYEQPADIIGVHPDWQGRVKSLIHFGTGAAVDVADNRIYVPTGAAKATPAAPGLVGLRVGDGGTTDGYVEASGAMPGFSGNATLVFFLPEIAATQGSNGAMLFAIPAAASYTQITPSGDAAYIFAQGAYSIGQNVLGTKNTTIIMRAAGPDPAFFVNRKKTVGVAASLPAGPKTIRLGAWSSDGWQFNGVYGSVAVIAGAITDDEAYQLVDNPWMLYEAEPATIYSLPSAGGGVSGSLSATESGSDALAASGALIVAGALAASESGVDTITASGAVIVAGQIAVTETGSDAAAISGGSQITGSLSAQEAGADAAAIAGAVIVAGALSAAESGADAAVVSGAITIAGSLSAAEQGADTAIIVGGNILAGYLAAQEFGSDTAAASGTVRIIGAAAATESGADGFAASGSIGAADVIGNFSALESGADTIIVSGLVIVSGALAATETGSDTMQTDTGEGYPSSVTITVPAGRLMSAANGRTITLRPR